MSRSSDTPTNLNIDSRGPKYKGSRAWLMVALAVFIVAWGGNEFTPMMVFYRGEDVFSPVFVDALLAFYAVGIAIGLLVAGPLSDRYGRRVVMLPAPIVALIGSVLIAMGETSEPIIFTGRMLSGLALGMAMTAGGSWIKELSSPAFDPTAKPNSGAKRSAMAMTGGFAVGALIAGLLAQWGPIPGQLPYLIHVVLSIVTIVGLMTVPETRQSAHLKVKGSFLSDLASPSAKHPRFLLVVLPLAPWVFGCTGVAYAIMPALIQNAYGNPIAITAGITALALAFGFGIQQFPDLYWRNNSAFGQQIGLVIVIIGMLVAAWTAKTVSLVGALIVAVVLGLGYGITLLTGLTEVQRLASPDELGGLTAIYYVFTYVGFFFPMILTRLSEWFSYPVMLLAGVVAAILNLVLITVFSRKFIPAES